MYLYIALNTSDLLNIIHSVNIVCYNCIIVLTMFYNHFNAVISCLDTNLFVHENIDDRVVYSGCF